MGMLFIKKVVSLGSSLYKLTSEIHNMYHIWKRTKATRDRGRSFAMTVLEAEEAVKACMKDHTFGSSWTR